MVDSAYFKITGIVPHIHRLEMFQHTGHAGVIRDCLPTFKQLDADDKEPAYRYMSHFYLEGVKFTIYFWSRSYVPDIKIRTVSPTPESLSALSDRLPFLKVSSAEYALDFMCKSPESVPLVHWLLRRYCYFPGYAGNVAAGGCVFKGIDEERIENSVSYFWNNPRSLKGKPNAVKSYERGHDDTRREKGDGTPWWHMNDVDRVRLEFTMDGQRGDRALKKLGIKSIREFLHSPKMAEMLPGRFRFCAFKGSSNLPVEWGQYNELDASGGIECFHREYLAAKERGLNPGQYLVDSELMAPLMRKIHNALLRHDEQWEDAFSKCVSKRWATLRKGRGYALSPPLYR